MRYQGLDLNLLVALDALLTEQNVSVAAAKVHLSQSAMSGALNRLREYFCDELLVPLGRRMALTPRGEQLAAPVRAALLQIKHTIASPPEFDPGRDTQEFSLVASDYATVVAVAGGLRAIQAEAPHIRFHIMPVVGPVAGCIERGEVDMLITLEPYISNQHPSTTLFEDEYVIIAWQGNTSIHSGIDEDTYYKLGHVAVELGSSRSTVFDSWFLQSGKRKRRVEVTVSSFNLVPHLLIGTDRIGTVHRRLAELLAKSMELRIFPMPFSIPRVRQVIQWNRLSESDPATMWVRDRLVAFSHGPER